MICANKTLVNMVEDIVGQIIKFTPWSDLLLIAGQNLNYSAFLVNFTQSQLMYHCIYKCKN